MTDPNGDASGETTCHATCLLLGEDGVLIRGQAGAGKSSLCLELLDRAEHAGLHARLVGDDRIRLTRHHGRLVAHPHPALEGLIEIRGLGIRRLASWADAAVVRLVADLVEEQPRMPAGPETATLLTVRLPYLVLARHQSRAHLIHRALAALRCNRAEPRTSVASRTHFAVKEGTGPADP